MDGIYLALQRLSVVVKQPMDFQSIVVEFRIIYMKEETISTVASVLDAWNPLGEKAGSIEGLDGYRIETTDIISTINLIFGANNIEKAIARCCHRHSILKSIKRLDQKQRMKLVSF